MQTAISMEVAVCGHLTTIQSDTVLVFCEKAMPAVWRLIFPVAKGLFLLANGKHFFVRTSN